MRMSSGVVVPELAGQLALVTVQVLPAVVSVQALSALPLESEIFAFEIPVPIALTSLIVTLSKTEDAALVSLAV